MAVNYDLLKLAEDQHMGSRQLQQYQVASELARRAARDQIANNTYLRGREAIAGAIGDLPSAIEKGYDFRQKYDAEQEELAPESEYEEQVGDPNLPGNMDSIMHGIPSSRYNPGMTAPSMTPAVQNPPPAFDMTRTPAPNAAEDDREFYENLAKQYLQQIHPR